MTTTTTPWIGRFVWHDLMTTDLERSQAFYRELFDWSIESVPMGPVIYSMIVTGTGPIGGMMEEKSIPMSHWMPYCAVKDVDATAARCQELGGSVCVPPTDIPGTGRFAVCGDRQGAYFSIFAGIPESPGADPDQLAHGRVCWNELMTSDDDDAQRFYSALFGWTQQNMDLGEMGLYRVQMAGEKHAGGIMRTPMPGTPSWWCVYFAVNDLAQSTAKARELGAEVLVENQAIPEIGTFSLLEDPVGAMVALFQNR